jgi:hypothetical protein
MTNIIPLSKFIKTKRALEQYLEPKRVCKFGQALVSATIYLLLYLLTVFSFYDGSSASAFSACVLPSYGVYVFFRKA